MSRMTKGTRSFVSNVLFMSGTRLVTHPIHILTSILTARMLGPHDRGIYSLLFTLPGTLETFLKLGVAPANTYMICREKEKVSDVASNSIFFACGLGLIGIILVFVFKDYLSAKILWDTNPAYILLVVSLLPFRILRAYFVAIFYALNKFRLTNWRAIIGSSSMLVGMFLVLVVFRKELMGAVFVHVSISALMVIWFIWTIYRLYPLSFRLNLGLAKKTIRFGLKSNIQAIVTALHFRFDLYLVAYFLMPESIAFYSIAIRLAELINEFHRIVSNVLYPKMSASADSNVHRMTITVCRHVLFVESLAALCLFLTGKILIVSLYGEAYSPVAEPFYIILPGVIMLSLYNILGRNFTSRNKQQINILSGTLAFVVNTLLNLILIPRMGINGAALASTISYSLAAAMLLAFFRRESNQPLSEIVRIRGSDLSLYRDVINRSWSRARLALRPHAASE